MQLVLTSFLLTWLHVEASKFNLGFMVRLISSRKPSIEAYGVLISSQWIFDNAYREKGCPPYDYAEVGWCDKTKNMSTLYKLEKEVVHPNMEKIELYRENSTAYNMFVGENFVFLHKTKKQVTMVPGLVRPITLNAGPIPPRKGIVVYHDKNNNLIKRKVLLTTAEPCYQAHFKLHHIHERTMGSNIQEKMDAKFFCVDVSKFISGYQCCRSRALLVTDHILVGMMGWGTGCSPTYGVDPWVFTATAKFFKWTADIIDVQPETYPQIASQEMYGIVEDYD